MRLNLRLRYSDSDVRQYAICANGRVICSIVRGPSTGGYWRVVGFPIGTPFVRRGDALRTIKAELIK